MCLRIYHCHSALHILSCSLCKQVWDDDLADIAQGFADRCVWGHNSARGDSYPGYVGENLYLTTASSVDYTAVVESWEDEKDYYDYDTNSCAANRQCGHYTQVSLYNVIFNIFMYPLKMYSLCGQTPIRLAVGQPSAALLQGFHLAMQI